MPTLDPQLFVEDFLKRVRAFAKSENLNTSRLPKWVSFASVKLARINNSIVFLFEDSTTDRDTITDCGTFNSDLQFLLRLPPYMPKAASFKAPEGQDTGLILLHGEYGAERKVIFNITSTESALFNVGYVAYHSPLAIVNIFIQLRPSVAVLAVRFVPFALYVNERDSNDSEIFWNKCTPHLQDSLRNIHDSEAGDYYQLTTESKIGFLVSKERSLIIFGRYSEPEMSELLQIRDYLRKSYDAYLLKELPQHPMMSIEEKVKLWSLASRFCVMIDREPSGHLVEYSYVKDVRTILAILRPERGGSTVMIEDDPVDFPYIRTFRFKESPLEVIDNAVSWAEQYAEEKMKGK